MTRTIGEQVEEFIETYGLKKTTIDPKHDMVHAMTGFGVGEINEQRVNAIIDGLENTRPEPEQPLDPYFAELLKEAADEYMRETGDPQPKFANQKFHNAMKHAEPIDPREVEAFFQLGRKMNAAIEAETGRDFSSVTAPALAAVDFNKLDFSRDAFGIKEQFESPKNHRVESVARNVLEGESIRQTGQSAIPAVNKPWTLK